ncbi:hypothetical protein AMECASPLE_036767, partial [Ameca splendens]
MFRSLTSVKCRLKLRLISATSPRPAKPRMLISFRLSWSHGGAAMLQSRQRMSKERPEEQQGAEERSSPARCSRKQRRLRPQRAAQRNVVQRPENKERGLTLIVFLGPSVGTAAATPRLWGVVFRIKRVARRSRFSLVLPNFQGSLSAARDPGPGGAAGAVQQTLKEPGHRSSADWCQLLLYGKFRQIISDPHQSCWRPSREQLEDRYWKIQLSWFHWKAPRPSAPDAII